MKAWRLEAAAINARRKAGSREATARVQKEQRMAIAKLVGTGSNWLLDGLLLRGGYTQPMKAPTKLPKMRQVRPTFLQRLRSIFA